MSDRIEGDPSALEALTDELLATLPGLGEAIHAHRQALASFRAAEPNDLGGPQLADLSAELDASVEDLERLDVVPRTFARGLVEADRFARETAGGAWSWTADRFTDPLWVTGTVVGLGFGSAAGIGRWSTRPNPHLDGLTLRPIGGERVWDAAPLSRLGRADAWHRWGRRLGRGAGGLGFALSGVSQYLDDHGDPTLTTGDRIARTGGAAVVEGGAGLAGGVAGAKLGAAAGIAGGPIGMAAGASIGGVLGGIAGSELGSQVHEQLESFWDGAGDLLDGAGAPADAAREGGGDRAVWPSRPAGASG